MAENIVFIGLGSNLGDREKALNDARIKMRSQFRLVDQSNIYETPAWGYENQPHFLNQAIKVQTSLSPINTLKTLKQIEKEMGRKPSFRYGPRVIDLDILFFNDEIIKIEKVLTIPHPELVNRGFVLMPLLDIAADMIHPVEQKTISDLAKNVDAIGIRKINVNR